MKRKIILIGGAPTVGKSTMAKLLSAKLELPWISTDQTRAIMRTMTTYELRPELFPPEGHDAESFLTHFTAEEIVAMEREQGVAAWPGNKRLIENDYTWRDGFIVEGVNILPELLPGLKTSSDVRAVFLVDHDHNRTREVVYTRGLWSDAKTYPDHVKGKEVEWAKLFGEKLEKSAREYGYPVVAVEKDTKRDLAAVIEVLGL